MGKTVSVKFNDAEEARLNRAFAASEGTGLSSHIKQVYFDALAPNTQVIAGLRTDIAGIASLLEAIKAGSDSKADNSMVLAIVCGIYLMVRKSVPENVRAQADQMLDVSVIEKYLKGK